MISGIIFQMKVRAFLISIVILIFLFGCRSEIRDDRVKKEAQRSLEIALDYIQTQRQLHEFDLNRKIRIVNEKIKKIQAPARTIPDQDSRQHLAALEHEKADLERKIKVLIDNTNASTKRITEKWGKYNQSLEAMLKNMDDYLAGIPIDKDTLAKKDTAK